MNVYVVVFTEDYNVTCTQVCSTVIWCLVECCDTVAWVFIHVCHICDCLIAGLMMLAICFLAECCNAIAWVFTHV